MEIGLNKKNKTTCATRNIKYKDPYMLKVKQCKKICHANITQKKSGVAILLSK